MELTEFEKECRAIAPLFLQDLGTTSEMESCMAFGLCIDVGWHKLFKDLCVDIEAINKWLPESYFVKAEQVKEKFGDLCVYWTLDDIPDAPMQPIFDVVRARMQIAVDLASITCERCGKMAPLKKTDGWILHLCPDCYSKWKERKEVS